MANAATGHHGGVWSGGHGCELFGALDTLMCER
jgi:hypothetical protein